MSSKSELESMFLDFMGFAADACEDGDVSTMLEMLMHADETMGTWFETEAKALGLWPKKANAYGGGIGNTSIFNLKPGVVLNLIWDTGVESRVPEYMWYLYHFDGSSKPISEVYGEIQELPDLHDVLRELRFFPEG